MGNIERLSFEGDLSLEESRITGRELVFVDAHIARPGHREYMRAVEVGKESITKQSETPYASVISRNRRMVLEEDFNEIQRPQLIDHVPANGSSSGC